MNNESGGHRYGPRRVVLNVRVKMAQKGYKTVARLHRDLLALGCDIGHQQLLRIVDSNTKALNMDVLNALVNLFDCPVAELLLDVEGDLDDAASEHRKA